MEHAIDDPSEGRAPPDAFARFRRWAAAAVALGALGYLAYAMARGLSETGRELGAFRWGWYIPVLGLTLVNYGLRYLKWHYLLGRLGIPIRHQANLWVFTAGLAMVISPAKAGEMVKPYLVRVLAGAPFTKTIPALIAERVTDGIAVVCLAAVGVGTYYAEASHLILAVIGAIGAGLVALSSQRLVRGSFGILRRAPVLVPIVDRVESAYDATRICLAPAPLAVTVGLSLVAWFAECVGFWLVFRGLGVDAGLDVATFLYAFSTVFGAPSPGGMGMSDVALVEGSRALIAGLGDGEAVAASLLIRVATLWFGVLLGAIALIRMEGVIHRYRTWGP